MISLTRIATGLALSIALLSNVCVAQETSAASDKKPAAVTKFVVALKPDKNQEAMIAERTKLAAYLKEKLGRDVEVIVPLSGAVIQEGLKNGSIDVGYLSATDLILARKNNAASLLLAGLIDGKPYYQSYWVVLKDNPARSIEDLKGKPVAFASRTSTSGGVVPTYDLVKRKLISAETGDPEEFFGKGNVFYGTGYVSAVEKVLNGEAQAAACSYYVLDKDKHLTVDQRGKLRMLQEQGPVPTHVLAVRNSLSAEDKAALKKALLTLNDAPNTALRDQLFTSQLAEVDEEQHIGQLKVALDIVTKKK
ncbi:MAG: phosphate/phosphite/phosphonate ABC transporter substrate-binding protein [Candidatus Methylacidiphilales bacterium]|nr:phosphate/phosphite/phosphonate ABC transporter substrate-binding protein [Candidatus Methylacidiphilales bacterium]